jgi:hypothetical protein
VVNNHTGFNASLSPTFRPKYSRFENSFGWVDWEGFYAKDTVSFADLELRNLSLLFAETVEWQGWLHLNWYFDYDVVLGLAPRSTIRTALKERGAIERSVLGLKFPSGPLDYDTIGEREDGELTLGGVEPEFENVSFVDLPITNPESAARWGTRCASLTYENKTHRIHEDIPPGSIATFLSADPFIVLQGGWAWRLTRQVLPYMTGMIMGRPRFPCEKRSQLADLIINVGEGDHVFNLTLSGYEYTIKYLFEKKVVCFMAVSQTEAGVVGLGWPFLRNFYTVFDEENGRIRREFY